VYVEFRLLGDIEVWADGHRIDVGHARQRCVLAVLLAEVNRVVAVGQLVDRVWGEQRLPASPSGALQMYASFLRRALAGADDVAIVRQAPGYKVVADAAAVDLHRFRSLAAQARAAGSDDQAAALFEQALQLWRGEPFAGVDTPWVSDLRATLVLERQAAQMDLTDVQLRRGRHGELLAALGVQASERPLDERVAGQYMVALYRTGRQSEALDRYQQIRGRLADELGTDPSPPLQRVYQQILAADPALDAPEGAVAPGPWVTPSQLPALPRFFVGRAGELAGLAAAMGEAEQPHGPVVISAVGGTGGIGKTWLALRWAHQHLDQFPDGQLWVNLRGFDPSARPMSPAVALRGFLTALGVSPAAMPAELEARAGLYRSLVAGKRVLIVLDNARDTRQVIPLLPGTPGCAVLVTSRRQLTGLVTGHGARALDLGVFTESEARKLLARHLGAARLAAEAAATRDLLAHCAGMPLALSVAAARAAAHPDFPLAALAGELREAATRLDALETGDPAASVQSVLSWSCQALRPPALLMFRLLGLTPGPDISLAAAASLARLPAAHARTVLRELEDASLVQQPVPGRYRMHDLVRLYAAAQADTLDAGARAQALRRVVDYYLHTAAACDRLVAPHRPEAELGQPAEGCHPDQPADSAQARGWFEAERTCLVAAQKLAGEQGWHAHVWQLAWVLNSVQVIQGVLHGRIAAWQAGLAAAQELGQPALQARAHRFLGDAYAQAGKNEEAIRHLNESLTLAEHLDDVPNEVYCHLFLAFAWEQSRDYHQALAHASHARQLAQTLGRPVWEAQTLVRMGWSHAYLGQFADARAHCAAALALASGNSYVAGEIAALECLGYISHHSGDYEGAIGYYSRVLEFCRQSGVTFVEADIQASLADAYSARGQETSARRAWRRALDLYRAQYRTRDAARAQAQLDSLDRSHPKARESCNGKQGTSLCAR
jgi:DNA-binding SARP family transcriptional activator/tetratricopeptide (TPR) repeat protein